MTDDDLIITLKALSPKYSTDHENSREAIVDRIQHRVILHNESLKSCGMPQHLHAGSAEGLAGWQRRINSVSPDNGTKSQAQLDPFANCLAYDRTSGPRGGRPSITLKEHVMYRHFRAGCGSSNYKCPLAAATSAVIWTGEVPDPKFLVSPSAINSGMLTLHAADNLIDARALNEVLVAKPRAAFSLFYDDTVSGADKRSNLFIRGPFGEGDGQANLQNKFMSFAGCIGGAARTKAEATLQRLRHWANPVEGLFLHMNIQLVSSVVDHAQLPEAEALGNLMSETLVFELAAAKKTLADFG